MKRVWGSRHLRSMTTYFGQWSTHEDMVKDFSDYDYVKKEIISPKDMAKPEEVVFASYATPAYEGDAVVIFERGGKLWEVSASHCSCNGLENSWSPGEVTWAALGLRQVADKNGYCGWLYEHEDAACGRMRQLIAEHCPPETAA